MYEEASRLVHGRAAPAFALAESWVPSTALDSLILGSSVCPEPGLPELKSGVHSPDHKGHWGCSKILKTPAKWFSAGLHVRFPWEAFYKIHHPRTLPDLWGCCKLRSSVLWMNSPLGTTGCQCDGDFQHPAVPLLCQTGISSQISDAQYAGHTSFLQQVAWNPCSLAFIYLPQ